MDRRQVKKKKKKNRNRPLLVVYADIPKVEFSIQVSRQLSVRLHFRWNFYYISWAQSFECDQSQINRLSLCWDVCILRRIQYDFVIENVLWENFIELRILGTTSELRHSATSHSDWALRAAVGAFS